MEELDKSFSHAQIGKTILTSDCTPDVKGRTLRDLLERTDFDSWGVRVLDVVGLLAGETQQPIDGVLHDIMDGQMDADKLDFLIRDSVECRVHYGHGIDVGRFLRSLTTTTIMPKNKEPLLRLAIKRKGSASAEAFALARYQLYQSVYWHHTFRAIKSMLLTAAASILSNSNERFQGNLFTKSEFADSYYKHVVGVVIPPEQASGQNKKKTLGKEIDRLMTDKTEPEYKSKYSTDRTLRFLWKLSSGKERSLIEDLSARRYYKRIFEAPLAALHEESWMNLWEIFRSEKRVDLQDRIEKALVQALRTAIQTKSQERQSLVVDNVLQTFEDLAAAKHCFLIDLPTRGWTAAGDYPLFMSDYKRRHFREDAANSFFSRFRRARNPSNRHEGSRS